MKIGANFKHVNLCTVAKSDSVITERKEVLFHVAQKYVAAILRLCRFTSKMARNFLDVSQKMYSSVGSTTSAKRPNSPPPPKKLQVPWFV